MRALTLFLLLLIGSTSTAETNYDLEVVAEGMELPWAVAFLPDGDFLVTTRPGQIHVVTPDGNISEPLAGVPDTYYLAAGQNGFFDVLLDTDFENNNRIYLAFTFGTTDANATRVVSASFSKEAGLSDVEPIFTVSPLKDTALHFGGKLAHMSDGSLILTTGDGMEYREASQDTKSQLGKIVRFNTDGSAPTDNPFADGSTGDPYVWSYGHRNPQGLVVDGDNVYMHEHGPKGGDELNRIEKGANYGWPMVTHGINYSGAYVSPFKTAAGVNESEVFWVPSIAPSGLAIYRGDAFPEWDGDLFVGALVDRDVKRIELEDGQVVGQTSLFAELGERIRDVRVGPDGLIYLITDEGNLIRVKPQ